MIKIFKHQNNRELLVAFTARNIKIKYKKTVFGLAWALFMPMVVVFSGILVKVGLAKYSGREYNFSTIATILVKSLPWSFFVGALKMATNSLVGNMSMLTKINFPRALFPISYTLSSLFDFCIATTFFTVALFFTDVGTSIHLLWLPLIILFLIMFTMGWGMILSCANLFYRDVKYLIDVILTFAIFFTPVFYEADMFGEWKVPMLIMNPVGAMLECIHQAVVLHRVPDLIWLCYAGFMSVTALWVGFKIFDKAHPLFAENI